jgi:hypothetical protein
MVRKIVRAHAANSGTQERKSLLEILGGATCARAYTIKGQGQRVPYRLALLAAPTPPSTRQLRAPREALSPAKGRLPFSIVRIRGDGSRILTGTGIHTLPSRS